MSKATSKTLTPEQQAERRERRARRRARPRLLAKALTEWRADRAREREQAARDARRAATLALAEADPRTRPWSVVERRNPVPAPIIPPLGAGELPDGRIIRANRAERRAARARPVTPR